MNSTIKTLFGSLLCIAFSHIALAQNKDKYLINQLNKNGQKEGLWIETENYRRYETYYRNGKLHGLYKEFNYNGDLILQGEYTNDTMSGNWYVWNQDPYIDIALTQVTRNDHVYVNEYCGEYVPDFKCWCRSFHPNGALEQEYILLWDDGTFPLELPILYGQVRYYNDQNQLIRIDIHLDGAL